MLNVTKLLLLTLPPAEELAVRLLDCGREAGLTPFCGASRDGRLGAICFGLKNPQPKLDRLYPAPHANSSQKQNNWPMYWAGKW